MIPTPRDYQQDATRAICDAFARGVRRQLVCLATALGKTVVFAGLPRALRLRSSDIMLVVAHRTELIDHARKKILDTNPNARVSVEKAELRASGDSHAIVASIQTLTGDRLDEFVQRFRGRIALLVIDEAHRAASPSYAALIRKIIALDPNSLVVGFTATPMRGDNLALNTVFDEIVIERGAQWGIEHGYLVEPRCFRIESRTSLENVGTVQGDFIASELSHAINTNDRNSLVVSAYRQHTPGKKAIVFCASVAHANELTRVFNLAGVPALTANGTTASAHRRTILQRFRSGEVNVLINVGLFTEGFDVPSTEVVILARPTQSPVVFQQAIGRILRPLEETTTFLGPGSNPEGRRAAIAASAKPFGTILDIVDQSRRHRLISLPSLWGMPAALDPNGHSMSDVLGKLILLRARAPEAADRVTSYDEILTRLKQVEIFSTSSATTMDLRKHSNLLWRILPNGTYRLTLPTRTQARDRLGNILSNCRRELLEEIELAKQRGVEDSLNVAYEVLTIDPASVVEIHQHIDIRARADASGFDIVSIVNNNYDDIGRVTTRSGAFAFAEEWLAVHHQADAAIVSITAPWRKRPISRAQTDLLVKRYAVPVDLLPTTQGDASALITKLIDERRQRPAD